MNCVRLSDAKDGQVIFERAKQKSEEPHKNASNSSILSGELGQVKIKQESMDTDDSLQTGQPNELKQVEKTEIPSQYFKANTATEILARFESKQDDLAEPLMNDGSINELASCHGSFIKDISKYTARPCLSAISQLCHRSTMLAHKIWVDIFPRLWDLLDDKYQTVLAGEMGPFLCSGSHLHQGDCYRSSINTFVEGMANCSPAIPIRPAVLKYLGKTHNLWHRSALLLEEAAVACEDMLSVNPQLPMQQPWLDFGMFFVPFFIF